jgi:DNA-directed RNA polymerase specialized sigma subunit
MDRSPLDQSAGVSPVSLADVHKTWLRDPNLDNTSTLLNRLRPTIQKGIAAHVGHNASPTIVSRAKMLALDHARSYDPSSGASLPTHVFNGMQGLKRYASREGMVISMPERLLLQKKQLDRAHNNFRSENGRDPSDDELRQHSGLATRDIERVRRLPNTINEGRFYQDLGEDSPGLPAVEQGREAVDAWRDMIYHSASEPDKVILEHTLGLAGKPVLDNTGIAARLKISPSAVSQRKAALQQQLDSYYSLRT